ncbi:MAG: cache domain-containing protein, partial [Anaerolineae bacterium]
MLNAKPPTILRKPSLRLPVSLRTRLILANILVIAVSIAALGYYVYYRGQESTTFLTTELESNVQSKAVDTLTTTSLTQAQTLNQIFTTVRTDVNRIGVTVNAMLSQQATLGAGAYWNASDSLARLQNGSWDNTSRTDPASVFIPARVDLNEELVSELNTLKQLDFTIPKILESNPDMIAAYFGGPSGETLYYPNIDLANIVPPDFDVTGRPWYTKAAPEQNQGRVAVWSDPYLDAALHGLVVTTSYPIYDEARRFRGVVAIDVQLNRMSFLVSNIHVGKSGYAFVVDGGGRVMAMPPAGYNDLGYTADNLPLGESLTGDKLPKPLPAELSRIISKMKVGQTGLETIKINGQERYVFYRPIAEVGYSIAIVVPTAEMLTGAVEAKQRINMSATNTQQTSFVLIAIILGFALLASLWIGNTLIA